MCNKEQLSAALSIRRAVAVGTLPPLLLGSGYHWIIIGPAQPLVSTVVGLTHN